MAGGVILEDDLVIPFGVGTFAEFHRWVRTADFPGRGRIDFLAGSIEVDRSPEEFFLHGTLKTEIIAVLNYLVSRQGWGYVVSDSTRVSCPEVELSTEPDVVFLSKKSLAANRVRLLPSAGRGADRYVEVEGPPDLIVEIVSDSSVTKDTQRLPVVYFAAGVQEYWVADARGKELQFTIHGRGEDAFQPVAPDADGYQYSSVLDRRFRMTRSRDDQHHWVYELHGEHIK